ncbi:MAG: NADH-quinone oxidoreductase subunit M [Planctomycetes bacterium]|nr:NADH-quinone oxidoreductase subunit M [Planctomycetota bacterium]
MDYSRLLVFTILLPFFGAMLIWALAPIGRQAVRATALGVSLATFVLACILAANFPAGGEGEFAVIAHQWLGAESGVNVQFAVGLDGLSLWLFCLSSLLLVSSVLVSWEAIQERSSLFYAMLLLLTGGCLGVFAARDIILFYIFFEFTLLPLFFLIGIWGSEERRYAAVKFFLFTFAGSVLTFLGLLAIVFWVAGDPVGTGELNFSIPDLTAALESRPMPPSLQLWVFFGLFAGFAIKVPLFPLHTWLPLAHVQAPTAGSVFLAGVLLKIGTYGFVRFNIAMLPDATSSFVPVILWLAVIGIIYGAMVALVQTDMKRLIAYSSVSHLGFVMLGLFALNRIGVLGGTLQMVNHGISTGALFALVGMLYERYHTREIRAFGGLARRTPWLAFFFLLFTFSSIGLPGLNGFAGEFPILLGMFQAAWTAPEAWSAQYLTIAVLAVFGVVLGAWYMLWLVQRVFFGPVKEPHHGGDHHPAADLSWREVSALAPLAVLVFWIGLWPGFFLDRMTPTLDRTVAESLDHQPADEAEQLASGSARAIDAAD